MSLAGLLQYICSGSRARHSETLQIFILRGAAVIEKSTYIQMWRLAAVFTESWRVYLLSVSFGPLRFAARWGKSRATRTHTRRKASVKNRSRVSAFEVPQVCVGSLWIGPWPRWHGEAANSFILGNVKQPTAWHQRIDLTIKMIICLGNPPVGRGEFKASKERMRRFMRASPTRRLEICRFTLKTHI